jgi:hypothetical protein
MPAVLQHAIPCPESGLTFGDLYEHEGLARLDALFIDRLGSGDKALQAALTAARTNRPRSRPRPSRSFSSRSRRTSTRSSRGSSASKPKSALSPQSTMS